MGGPSGTVASRKSQQTTATPCSAIHRAPSGPTPGEYPAGNAAPALPERLRALQRLYVSHLSAMVLSPARGTPAEGSQVARSTLREIRSRIRRVTGSPQRLSALDGYSRAHLEDLDATITRALEAKAELKAGS